jgi:hypothetical protein
VTRTARPDLGDPRLSLTLYSVIDLARRWRVPPRQVRRWIRSDRRDGIEIPTVTRWQQPHALAPVRLKVECLTGEAAAQLLARHQPGLFPERAAALGIPADRLHSWPRPVPDDPGAGEDADPAERAARGWQHRQNAVRAAVGERLRRKVRRAQRRLQAHGDSDRQG